MKANDLLEHAPAYHRWVDDLLAKHEMSAKQVTTYEFQRLPKFFNEEILASAKCVEVDSLPKIPGKNLVYPFLKGWTSILKASHSAAPTLSYGERHSESFCTFMKWCTWFSGRHWAMTFIL